MSAPVRPHLKSITTTPDYPPAASQPLGKAAVGEPKGAARKGVRTALRSDRFRAGVVRSSDDPTLERPGIRIYAPPVYRYHYDGARWSKRHATTPSAAYACRCGQTGAAKGQDSVAVLVREYATHTFYCTGTPATPMEGRAAA